MWNGQLTTSNGSGPWIHEGSADAFADLLLRELGVNDDEKLRQRREEALNACFLRLEGLPIKRSTSPRTPYECGQTMALWTERALALARADADLFGFWNALIESSLENDGVYDAARYLDVLGSLGVGEGVRDRMRLALEGEPDPGEEGGRPDRGERPNRRASPAGAAEGTTAFDPVAIIVAGLRDAGLPIESGGEAAPAYRHELARRAMGHVMASACDGRLSYAGVRTLTTFRIEGCEPFETGQEVAEINGFAVSDEGDEIYDSVVETCAAGGVVRLGGLRVRWTCG